MLKTDFLIYEIVIIQRKMNKYYNNMHSEKYIDFANIDYSILSYFIIFNLALMKLQKNSF